MAYGVKWLEHTPAEAKRRAEERAGKLGQIQGLGYLYRFEDHTYAARIDPYDDSDDNWTSVGPYLELYAFQVRSKTPCGHTIYFMNAHGWRFINRGSTKQYALPTVEEALESYIARKKRQHAIYQAKADRALKMMEVASASYNKLAPPDKLAM